MFKRALNRHRMSFVITILAALGLVVGTGIAPAQAGPPPLQLLVTWHMYDHEFGANAPFFGQNGFIVDRATEFAESYADCPQCAPVPSTPLPAGYTNARMVSAYVDGNNNLDVALGDALFANGAAIIDGTNANTWGGVGTWTNGNRTYAVLILADYVVAPLDEIPLDSVSISGTPRVGLTLTAVVTPPTQATYQYQWSANGTPFGPLSSSPSIQLKAPQLGKHVVVTVTATQSGSVTRSATSSSVGPILPAYLIVPKVIQLQGQFYVGQQISVSRDTIAQFQAPGSELHLRYIWTRDGRPILRAPNEPVYTLVPADAGKFINVVIIAKARGYHRALVESDTTIQVTSVLTNR